MLERGTLQVGSYRGAPILLHWSLLLGLLAFGGLAVVPGFWIGFSVLILLHELGHAYLVHRLGFRVEAVVVHGFGGFCRWDGKATRVEHSIIAWGGVLAQAMLLLATLATLEVVGEPSHRFGIQLEDAWVRANLWIMALNLLPVPPLDGADAWQLARAMRVESVSFGQVLRRCLPRWGRGRGHPGRGPTKRSAPSAPGPSAPAPKSEAKPSPEAQQAIADALRKISEQARDARRKK